MTSVRDGISSGDIMGDTEAGVARVTLESDELMICDSFIKEFTTASLKNKVPKACQTRMRHGYTTSENLNVGSVTDK